ncbi:hypothetical protein ACFLZI_00075 [Nitrospirota bacterium]
MYEDDHIEEETHEADNVELHEEIEEGIEESSQRGGLLYGLLIGTVVGLAFLGAMLVFFKPGAIAKIKAHTPWAQTAATQPPGSGGCGSGGGGAAGCGGSGAAASPELINNIKTSINEYYNGKLGSDFTVEVRDFGCHQEAYVLIDGKAVKKLSISGSRISEISLQG